MAEIERTRERERSPLQNNTYERIMRARAELLERNMTGEVVVRKADRPFVQTRQGKLRYYLEPITIPTPRCRCGGCSPTKSRPDPASTGTKAGS